MYMYVLLYFLESTVPSFSTCLYHFAICKVRYVRFLYGILGILAWEIAPRAVTKLLAISTTNQSTPNAIEYRRW